eukprot:m51a1_g3063 hypothetical protein (248) ;mRNA; f:1005444-1006398
MKTEKVVSAVSDLLAREGDDERGSKMEGYMKGAVRSRGIAMPALKEHFRALRSEGVLADLSHQKQIDVGFALQACEFFEDKRVGSLLLSANIKNLSAEHMPRFASIFDTHVNEWATCDTLSSTVISLMVKQDAAIGRIVAAWKDDGTASMWRLRACCVTFVKLARFGKWNQTIFDICEACIRSQHQPERFLQLGMGWVLRELSLSDKDAVVAFVKQRYSKFSREGLRYVVEKMEPEDRVELLSYRKK